MNKREKEVLGSYLDDEKKTLNYLKQVYKKSAEDIRERIAYFNAREDMNDPHLASIIYQRKYQEALLKQIETGLQDLNKNQYKTMQEFFEGCYVNGYVGAMYNFEGQGIPLTVPIDPKKMVRAVQTDSKLSRRYYQKRLFPENVERLKLSIKAEVSRGIASGSSWLEVAHKVASGMNSPFNRALNDAVRIVRTEGHRINQEGYLDAGDEAKKKGADILKQWDATLDSRTRPWHQEADGQIREWDEDFTVNGEKMKAPSVGGSASNVINCRCQLLQRARWALDEDELKTLEERANFYGLDKSKDFEDFKEKFLNLPSEKEQKIIDLSERRKRRLAERRQQEEKKAFVPAQDIKEVKRRVSEALGIDESVVNLGRMNLDLANEYLDGIETFMNDFPQMKGLYTAMNTKRCRSRTLGVNVLEGKGRYVGKDLFYDCVLELSLKNPKDLNDLRKTYEYAVSSAQHYKGASPKATAIHELVHGLTHAIEMKKNGYLVDGVFQRTIPKREWDKYTKTGTWSMVNAVKDELYGMRHGREVFDGMKHLGSYAMTNADETVAQAVSYEIINPTESKPFSAKIFEALKKEVGDTFK